MAARGKSTVRGATQGKRGQVLNAEFGPLIGHGAPGRREGAQMELRMLISERGYCS